MTNSRAKGKRGELEAAAALRKHLGIEARRGQQYHGGSDAPDLRHSLPGIHIEVKRVERLNLDQAMDQAQRESGSNTPLVLHRRNRRPWLVTVRLEDLLAVARVLSGEGLL